MPRGIYKRKPLSRKHKQKISKSMKGLIPWNKGKPRSEETKRKISLAIKGKKRPWNTGEKNCNWKGGITPINEAIRNSLEYKLWRKAVYERDNYTCVWCGDKKGNNLQADHIKRFSDYPELRFVLDNGRTLCKKCHETTDTYGSKKLILNKRLYVKNKKYSTTL